MNLFICESQNPRFIYSLRSIIETKDGKNIIKRYERLIEILSSKEESLFTEWAAIVPKSVSNGLNRPLLIRTDSSLALNFDQELLAVLKEVNYLKLISHTDIPNEAVEVR